MRLRQAKKIMGWCKGEGNSRSKDHRKSFWRKCNKLRPDYYDERGVWMQPSCHDIDIIRRAHTRLFRWIREHLDHRADIQFRQFEKVCFHLGYTNTTMTFRIRCFMLSMGKEEWGAEPNKHYFVIKLGERIEQ